MEDYENQNQQDEDNGLDLPDIDKDDFKQDKEPENKADQSENSDPSSSDVSQPNSNSPSDTPSSSGNEAPGNSPAANGENPGGQPGVGANDSGAQSMGGSGSDPLNGAKAKQAEKNAGDIGKRGRSGGTGAAAEGGEAAAAGEKAAEEATKEATKEAAKEATKEAAKETAKGTAKAAAKSNPWSGIASVALEIIEQMWKAANSDNATLWGLMMGLALMFVIISTVLSNIPSLVFNIVKQEAQTVFTEAKYTLTESYTAKGKYFKNLFSEYGYGDLSATELHNIITCQSELDENNIIIYKKIMDYALAATFKTDAKEMLSYPAQIITTMMAEKESEEEKNLISGLLEAGGEVLSWFQGYSLNQQLSSYMALTYPYSSAKADGTFYTIADANEKRIPESQMNDQINYAEFLTILSQSPGYQQQMISYSDFYDRMMDKDAQLLLMEMYLGKEHIWFYDDGNGHTKYYEASDTKTEAEARQEAINDYWTGTKNALADIPDELSSTLASTCKTTVENVKSTITNVVKAFEGGDGLAGKITDALGELRKQNSEETITTIETQTKEVYQYDESKFPKSQKYKDANGAQITIDVADQTETTINGETVMRFTINKTINGTYSGQSYVDIKKEKMLVEEDVEVQETVNNDDGNTTGFSGIKGLIKGRCGFFYKMDIAPYGLDEVYYICKTSPYDASEYNPDFTNLELLDYQELIATSYLYRSEFGPSYTTKRDSTSPAYKYYIQQGKEPTYRTLFYNLEDRLGKDLTSIDWQSLPSDVSLQEMDYSFIPEGQATILDMPYYICQGNYPEKLRGTAPSTESGKWYTIAEAACCDCAWGMSMLYLNHNNTAVSSPLETIPLNKWVTDILCVAPNVVGQSFNISTFSANYKIKYNMINLENNILIPITNAIDSGFPVIIEIKGQWNDSAGYVYHAGSSTHWIVIKGYTEHGLLVYDPGKTANNSRVIPFKDWERVTIRSLWTASPQDSVAGTFTPAFVMQNETEAPTDTE